jgi:hypothetical protein
MGLFNYLFRRNNTLQRTGKLSSSSLSLTNDFDSENNGLSHGHDSIKFTIHKASGGYVLESVYYDEGTDRRYHNLHIISSEEDFNEELGKAVFMDLLRKK